MTDNEIIVIVGGLLFGYLIVTSLFNMKSATKTGAYSNKDRTYHKAPDNDNSGEKNKWFRILEVSEDASQEQITIAYKQKIGQYHPDKVAKMGAEIRELAEFKSKQINAAYDYAVKLRR